MRRPVLALLALILVATACGGDDAAETTSAGATMPNQALAVVDLMHDAISRGDAELWRSLYSEDTETVLYGGDVVPLFGPTSWVNDDFDNDGVASVADLLQFDMAFHEVLGSSWTWECSPVGRYRVECVMRFEHRFDQLAGVEPSSVEQAFRVEDGLIVQREFTSDPGLFASVLEARSDEMLNYERWVMDEHPDLYESVFRLPCCDVDMVLTPGSLAVHAQLVPEYLAGS